MRKAKNPWINGLFLAVTLAINALGAFGFINGLTQKEISDMYTTLITPSPSTFSIWSVIYSLLIISVIVMIVKNRDHYYKNATNQISTLFKISCIFNVLWIITFSYVQIKLSVLFILGLVITLSLICKKLLNVDDGRHWLLPLTFGMYTGWLFIATVVNIAAMLVKLKWDGFGIGQDIWAIIMLVIAILLVIPVLSKIRNAVFSLPIAWAYFGIYQNLKSPEGFNGQFPLVEMIALGGVVVLVALAIITFYRNHFSLISKYK